jgi:hypothetical protein
MTVVGLIVVLATFAGVTQAQSSDSKEKERM